ncbi:MAG TPA: hypothetical protein VNQ77_08455 [Frankiaceae bacterium]|nr:hypothetical protein [Frankiaceae bacterium]
MERSVLVRRTAPVAVFAAVLGGLLALAAGRDGGAGSGEPRRLPLSMGFRAEGGGAAPRDAATGSSMPAMYSGEIVIPERLLAGVPTEGPVRTVTKGDTGTERIAALAQALGVTGEVQSDADGWFVGTGDKVLRVMRHPGSPWYLGADKVSVGRAGGAPVDGTFTLEATSEPKPPAPSTPSADPDEPVSSDDTPECKPTPDGTDICVIDPAPADCPPPPDGAEPACEVPAPRPAPSPPPQPSDADARAVAQRVFDAVGVTGAVTFNDAWLGKEVVVAPEVAGLPTLGFETRVTVDVEGAILYAAGYLGGTEPDALYPLLAPRDAAYRVWGHVSTPAIGVICPEDEPCPKPEQPQPREATTLRLGLMLNGSYDGKQAFLTPAWLLTFEGSTWPEPLLALPDRYLEQPPAVDQPLVTDPGGEVPPDGGAGSTGDVGTGGTSGGLRPGTAPVEPGSTGAPE